MNRETKPLKIIELDLPEVMRKSLKVTLFSFILLLGLHSYFSGLRFSITLWTFFLFIIGYLLLIVLHEFFHLLGFHLFAKVPWKQMNVGVDLKQGIAYATTDKLMQNKPLRKALLLPFWMTGILPAIIGLSIGSGLLVILSSLLIGGAAGDFVMYKELKKMPHSAWIKDHPTKPILTVYATKEDSH